jgi:hypothetical protein
MIASSTSHGGHASERPVGPPFSHLTSVFASPNDASGASGGNGGDASTRNGSSPGRRSRDTRSNNPGNN